MSITMDRRYKALIEERFSGDFEYVDKTIETKEDGTNHYYITVRCLHCGEHKTATYMTFKNSKVVKCICKNTKGIKKSAEKYAKDLYRDMYGDGAELGYIVGEELKEYIRACTVYDRPAMVQIPGYLDMVYEAVEKLYKKDKIGRCCSCGKYLAEKHMYSYSKRICKKCNAIHQKERKRKAVEKERRKYR